MANDIFPRFLTSSYLQSCKQFLINGNSMRSNRRHRRSLPSNMGSGIRSAQIASQQILAQMILFTNMLESTHSFDCSERLFLWETVALALILSESCFRKIESFLHLLQYKTEVHNCSDPGCLTQYYVISFLQTCSVLIKTNPQAFQFNLIFLEQLIGFHSSYTKPGLPTKFKLDILQNPKKYSSKNQNRHEEEQKLLTVPRKLLEKSVLSEVSVHILTRAHEKLMVSRKEQIDALRAEAQSLISAQKRLDIEAKRRADISKKVKSKIRRLRKQNAKLEQQLHRN
eukprot:TRINITY_DN9517_c0_g1_i1.p1 TRINITY_DN9517_c0_g1~~TRINITY_DN9517_c0_g1_i1.p1  ORF type:complete len:321 (+),score=34.32 TRINITY_DN9517_c0_g1_i1:112-963(+)